MTPRAQDSAGKGCLSGVHSRQTNLTPRHVTTTLNMSAQSAMDQKEFEDRLAAAEALSSLGSITSIASALKDSDLLAQVSLESSAVPQNDKRSKGEARGRGGGGGRKKDEKGTGRETKSRSTRGRGRAKVVQADRTPTSSVVTATTFLPHVDGLPGETVPHASAVAATPKPSTPRGRGRPRGRGGGGKRGSKTSQPVPQDGVASASESLARRDTVPGFLSQSAVLLPQTVTEKTGVHAFVMEKSGTVPHPFSSTAAAVSLGRSIPPAAFVPALASVAGFVGLDARAVTLSTVGASSSTPSSMTSSSAVSSSPHAANQSKSATSPPSSTATTLTLSSPANLPSLHLDSLPSLSLGSTVFPNLPSIPNLPSLPSAVAALHLAGPSLLKETPAVSEDASSQLSPQSRDSGEKSLPLKKRKVIDSSPLLSVSSSSSSSSSVPKASSVSPVSPAVKSPVDAKSPVELVPSTSAGTTQAEKSREEAESPAPVLPMNLLAQVLPPAMCRQLMSEIETAITPDEDGDVPLHIAVVHENEAMVKKLIQLMALAGQKVDRYNKQHQTPLHLAVKLTSLSAIQMLLEAGADPNLVDSGGLTSTHMAVQGGDIDCLEALLQWGRHPCDLNYRNFEGLAPLHTAVMTNELEMVMRLLDQGADVNIMDGKSGRTVLFHAAETNQRAMVELLLSRGADPEIANYAGVVPALAAQGRNHSTVARLLARALEEGGEVTERGMEEGRKEKEGQRGGNNRHSPCGVETPGPDDKRGVSHPHPPAQEQGPRPSAPSPAQIRHAGKTSLQSPPSSTTTTTTPPLAAPHPSILQSSSLPGSSATRPPHLVGSPALGKPADAGPAPRRPPPGSIIRATHQMPGVVSKMSKGPPGTPVGTPRSVMTMVRRNSVPVKTDPHVTSAAQVKSATPPLNLAASAAAVALPLGLVRAPSSGVGVGAERGPATPSSSSSTGQSSGERVVGIKREVGGEEFDGQDAQRSVLSVSAAASAMSPEDIKKLLMHSLLKFVEEKQNGGQPRVLNWPPLSLPLSLAMPVTADPAVTHSPPLASSGGGGGGGGGSHATPLRGVNRVIPLPVPTSSVMTSPAVGERGLSSLPGTATPSAAHSQPTRPLLVVRSSAMDPVSADGRRMGSVELRHVTTDALLALQHSSTNSVNFAGQNLTSSSLTSSSSSSLTSLSSPPPLHFQPQGQSFLASMPAGFTVAAAAETEKVPPVANHVARKNLPSQVVAYASDGYSDEPKDLSLKSKKNSGAESVGSVKNLKPDSGRPLTEGARPPASSKGGGARKRHSETPAAHDHPSKPSSRKLPKVSGSGSGLRANEKPALENKLTVGASRIPQGSMLVSPSPEGAVISISESGVVKTEMTLEGLAPIVELNKSPMNVQKATDLPMRLTLPKTNRLSEEPGPPSEPFRGNPASSSQQRLRIPDPRKKLTKGDAVVKPSHGLSLPSTSPPPPPPPQQQQQPTDISERRDSKDVGRSGVSRQRGDNPQCSNSDGRDARSPDLRVKDPSLAIG